MIVTSGWGFFGHQSINRLAVFTLPAEMSAFYKANIHYIVEASVYPDQRRYAVAEEGPRHYIDLDDYSVAHSFAEDTRRERGGYAEGVQVAGLPKYWNDAVEKLGKDSLMAHGIVPWHAYRVFQQLREAFTIGDPQRILRLSSELGHYVADAHVPLHTTSNHNGQKTDQHGIHGLWESRLPELHFTNYDFFVGRATYVHDVQAAMWDVVAQSHACVDSVLNFERDLSKKELSRKYSFETRAKHTIKVYSERYSRMYHVALDGMVERRMRRSVKMVGDLWYTAWVDSGQPDLKRFLNYRPTEEELNERRREIEQWKDKKYLSREEDLN